MHDGLALDPNACIHNEHAFRICKERVKIDLHDLIEIANEL